VGWMCRWPRSSRSEEVAAIMRRLGRVNRRGHEWLKQWRQYIAALWSRRPRAIDPVGFYSRSSAESCSAQLSAGRRELVGGDHGRDMHLPDRPGARSANTWLRRGGPLAGKWHKEFGADALSYLLFLRVVPIVPSGWSTWGFFFLGDGGAVRGLAVCEF